MPPHRSSATKSKASANTSYQKATATRGLALIPVNFVFFDESHRRNSLPRNIKIPRSLFGGISQECRSLFAAELLHVFKFKADEHSIEFWRPKEHLSVTKPYQKGWIQSITNFESCFELIPLTHSLSKALKRQTNNNHHVHIVVTAERAATVQEHNEGHVVATVLPEIQRYRKIVSTPGQVPPDAAKYKEYFYSQASLTKAIHDGRHPPNPPFPTVAPPIQIFHPIFNSFVQFVDDPSVQPTSEDLKLTQEFMHLLSIIDTSELKRDAEIRMKLTEILGLDVHEELKVDKSSADGVHMFILDRKRLPLLIIELKRELGDGSCDPSTQAGLSMRRSWIQDERSAVRDKCCCPTLMLAGSGPWMGILGGVFTDKIIVQRLTDLIWVGHSSTEEDARVYRFARVLNALRTCILRLQTYYDKINAAQNLSLVPGHTHSRFYPHPNSFTEENGQVVHFEYLEMMEEYDPACVTYKAKISKEDIVLVKFVSRYSKEVHEFLAAKGHAPRLRYCGPLPNAQEHSHATFVKSALPGLSLGPMQMVVMNYISVCKGPPANARQQLETVLETLHVEGYVFGDIRRPKILFDEKNKVNLIDFGWAGPFDMKIRDASLPAGLQKKIDDSQRTKVDRGDGNYVHYPLNLSKSVSWADGVTDLKPIRPAHDWDMLRKLIL